jgi:hypothetical protein
MDLIYEDANQEINTLVEQIKDKSIINFANQFLKTLNVLIVISL